MINFGTKKLFQKILDFTTFSGAHLHLYKKLKTYSTSTSFTNFLQSTTKINKNLQMEIKVVFGALHTKLHFPECKIKNYTSI